MVELADRIIEPREGDQDVLVSRGPDGRGLALCTIAGRRCVCRCDSGGRQEPEQIEERALIGWSQSDLAEKIGVVSLTIKRLEGGKLSRMTFALVLNGPLRPPASSSRTAISRA
jgi:hypothetical protein